MSKVKLHKRIFLDSSFNNIRRCFWCNAAEFTKKIKVPIDGSPTKNQKTMGTLIFWVNFAALHQKHLNIL